MLVLNSPGFECDSSLVCVSLQVLRVFSCQLEIIPALRTKGGECASG